MGQPLKRVGEWRGDGFSLTQFTFIYNCLLPFIFPVTTGRPEPQGVSPQLYLMLFNLFVFRGIPEHIRSDNGSEFTARAVRKWLNRLGVKTLFIEPGSPWENGYIESFNGKMRDELLDREIFTTLEEAKILINQWRRKYNHFRPHSAKNYRPPAHEATMSFVLT